MGVHEKPIYSGELPKKDGGAERVCRFRGGLTIKEEGDVFERGWYPNAHYDRLHIYKNGVSSCKLN